jgi:hypothetical protein
MRRAGRGTRSAALDFPMMHNISIIIAKRAGL